MVGSEGTTKSQAGKAAGKDTDVPFFFFFFCRKEWQEAAE